MSPVIYEVLDFACGLCNSELELIAQTNGITLFTVTFSTQLKSVVDAYCGDMRAGDIYVTNDPYHGGTHACDFAIIRPIFSGKEMIAYALNVAHWVDVGGAVPGSLPPNAISVFQEGLRLSRIRLARSDIPNEEIIRIIRENTRLPEIAMGDLNAQIATVRIAENRVMEVVGKYGVGILKHSFQAILSGSELRSRAVVEKLPDGIYEASGIVDGDGVTHDPIPVRVKVTIAGDSVEVDFTGCPPAVAGPINCGIGALASAVKSVFKALVAPHEPSNEGWFRPLKAVAPPGTLFTAEKPSPAGWYYEGSAQASELVWKALAALMPERFSAGSYSSLCVIYLSGRTSDGHEFIHIEPTHGGWGACAGQDGANAVINILSFGVGGTTAKCSVIVDGKPRVYSEYRMQRTRQSPGYPVQVPVVDIVEIGAGGGSIAHVDSFGALMVGPKSAGAKPGPVCYGLGGTEPTVTDAKLVTGVVDAVNFAGGTMVLDVNAARGAICKLGAKIGLGVDEAAQAIVDVAEANMINALKLVTIQRGYDPRDFSLVISGGAGPMFAASPGRELNVKRIVVPPHAGIFSAWGMLAARPRADIRKTWFRELTDANMTALEATVGLLEQEALDYFGLENRSAIEFSLAVQLRYRGQEHSVDTTIQNGMLREEIAREFHSAHKKAYSFSLPHAPIELTGVHLVGENRSHVISCPVLPDKNLTIEGAVTASRPLYLGVERGWINCKVLDRDKIPVEVVTEGPLLIEEPATAILVLDGREIERNERGIVFIRERRGG